MSIIDEILDDIEEIEKDLRKKLRKKLATGITGAISNFLNPPITEDPVPVEKQITKEDYEVIHDVKAESEEIRE